MKSLFSEEAHTNHDVGTKHNAMIKTARKEGFYCYVNNDSSWEGIENFLAEGLPVIIHFAEPQAERGTLRRRCRSSERGELF